MQKHFKSSQELVYLSVDSYNAGKTNALGYLVGQCMKASKGKANPGMMKEIILKKISG